MRKRTRARQFALEVLYQADLMGPEVLEEALLDMIERADDPEVGDFAVTLVRGTHEHVAELDDVIRSTAENWDLSRMATIDRNILRLGAYELLHRDDIPPKVSINEAIELGKHYSTAESGTFVNGILDRIKNTNTTTGTDEPSQATEESRPTQDLNSDGTAE